MMLEVWARAGWIAGQLCTNFGCCLSREIQMFPHNPPHCPPFLLWLPLLPSSLSILSIFSTPHSQTPWDCTLASQCSNHPYHATFTCSTCAAGTRARQAIPRRFSYYNDRLQTARGRLYPSKNASCPRPRPLSHSLATQPLSHPCLLLATTLLKDKVASSPYSQWSLRPI